MEKNPVAIEYTSELLELLNAVTALAEGLLKRYGRHMHFWEYHEHLRKIDEAHKLCDLLIWPKEE